MTMIEGVDGGMEYDKLSAEEVADGAFKLGTLDVDFNGNVLRLQFEVDEQKPFPYRISTYRFAAPGESEELVYTGGFHANSSLSAYEGLIGGKLKELDEPIREAVIQVNERIK